MSVSIQCPIGPFDYGAPVQWTDADGRCLRGDIVAFLLRRADGAYAAVVERGDGGDVTVPLSKLRLRLE
ncbi:MAG: hypothetical protein DI565_03780 [Ancylobacter novellus]|uniref:Uncharacterized protein n=1 Tax=Ancylobacter novellus TaxID=921 RepID=A0A2W5MW23_ANCNO|nr:MAG: hypothetical protein DI565_03780 [Ancylobacter novellus]